MSRTTEVLNDLELATKKLGMSVEEAVKILLGEHPTHTVNQGGYKTTPLSPEASAPEPSVAETPEPPAA